MNKLIILNSNSIINIYMLLIAYDITDDRLRTKFSKFLTKYGRKVQYSVYEVKNSGRVLGNILSHIDKLFIKKFENTDSVLIYNLCEACNKKAIKLGYAKNEDSDILFM